MTSRSIQVTLGAVATPISTTSEVFNQMIVQNNSAAACRLGDSTVSATKGISMAAAAATPPVVIGPFVGQEGDASQFYLFGTSGDLIDILLI